jgi:hypothetical protein
MQFMTFELCNVLGYYTMCSGYSLPVFWDNLSVPSSRVKNIFADLLHLLNTLARRSH